MSRPTACPITGALREYDGNRLLHSEDQSPCYGESGRILRIMPATGWQYVCAIEGADGKAELLDSPVVAFAVIELCDGEREVAPLAAVESSIDRADQVGNFLGLVGPGEDASLFQKDAEGYVARAHARKTTAAADPEDGR